MISPLTNGSVSQRIDVTLRVGYLITSPWPSPGRRGNPCRNIRVVTRNTTLVVQDELIYPLLLKCKSLLVPKEPAPSQRASRRARPARRELQGKGAPERRG